MEVHVKRAALCLILVLLGLTTLTWAGSPEGALPAAATAASAASPDPDPASPAPAPSPVPAVTSPSVVDSLLNLMITKGVITTDEAKSLRTLPAGQQVTPLLALLAKKGVLSQEELAALTPSSNAGYSSSASFEEAAYTQAAPAQGVAPAAPPKPPGPKVIPAVAPIRVLPIDPPKREGLIPDLKIGPVRLKPYGFFKTSVVSDSSQPRGDDFPLPGFIYGDTGPNASPEFHIKARSSRFGSSFEWLDPSPKLTITGKIEFDFEGNFSAADNRNVSSIRSNMPSLRLAFGRLDYAATDTTTVFAVFGQDWTPFGSSVLPNTLETTGVGIGFGSLYERNPQVRSGFVHNFGGSRTFKLSMEGAAVMPAFGNVPGSSQFQIPGTVAGNNIVNVVAPAGGLVVGGVTIPAGTTIGTVTIPQTANTGLGLQEQLGYGERQGADSNRPEAEARVVAQFQLDPAPGVAPAQLIVSGVDTQRTVNVLKANVPSATAASGLPAAFYKEAFPNGVQVSSDRYGIAYQAQLPTRWFTLLTSYYHGADLRYFFAGQLYSYYNNTAALGLKNTVTAPSIDGSAAVVFGTLNGGAYVASQKPVRTNGGFVELGLPLSRWAKARPEGRNAGWTMNLHYGLDDVVARDERKLNTGGQRDRSDWMFGNLQYKLNSWVTFAYEQSLYRTFSLPPNSLSGACATSPVPISCYTGTVFKGYPSREWKDVRSEFSTIFTF